MNFKSTAFWFIFPILAYKLLFHSTTNIRKLRHFEFAHFTIISSYSHKRRVVIFFFEIKRNLVQIPWQGEKNAKLTKALGTERGIIFVMFDLNCAYIFFRTAHLFTFHLPGESGAFKEYIDVLERLLFTYAINLYPGLNHRCWDQIL